METSIEEILTQICNEYNQPKKQIEPIIEKLNMVSGIGLDFSSGMRYNNISAKNAVPAGESCEKAQLMNRGKEKIR